jgi:hypothetical protein
MPVIGRAWGHVVMPSGFVLAVPVSAFDVRRDLRGSADLCLYIDVYKYLMVNFCFYFYCMCRCIVGYRLDLGIEL